ncbi:unnamed protein product [Leuciscus chuanchicus]
MTAVVWLQGSLSDAKAVSGTFTRFVEWVLANNNFHITVCLVDETNTSPTLDPSQTLAMPIMDIKLEPTVDREPKPASKPAPEPKPEPSITPAPEPNSESAQVLHSSKSPSSMMVPPSL